MSAGLVNFVRDLAKFLRGNAADPGVGRTLWTYAAVEGEAGASGAYTVLAPYPGAARAFGAPLNELSLQLMTTGLPRDPESAAAQAEAYHAKLLDTAGRPLRDVTLDGFKIKAVLNLRGPGVVDRDERERTLIATNFEVKYHAL